MWQGNTPAEDASVLPVTPPKIGRNAASSSGLGNQLPMPPDKIAVKAPLNAMGAFFEGVWAKTADFWTGAPEGRFCEDRARALKESLGRYIRRS